MIIYNILLVFCQSVLTMPFENQSDASQWSEVPLGLDFQEVGPSLFHKEGKRVGEEGAEAEKTREVGDCGEGEVVQLYAQACFLHLFATVIWTWLSILFDSSRFLATLFIFSSVMQRWSPRGRPWPRGRPRGHILKSLALALKVKSLALASRPQVLENWPVLGSRTALFFGMLKFCGALEKFLGKRFLVEIAWKIFVKTSFFFFWRALALCVLGPWPWPQAFLSLASRVSVLGKAVLGLGLGFFCVLGLGLEPCVLDSTSGVMPLLYLYSLSISWFVSLISEFQQTHRWSIITKVVPLPKHD